MLLAMIFVTVNPFDLSDFIEFGVNVDEDARSLIDWESKDCMGNFLTRCTAKEGKYVNECGSWWMGYYFSPAQCCFTDWKSGAYTKNCIY